jgi:transposase-like protein
MKFSKEEKAMWLEDWKQSGKNPWTYARENGLVPQTFTGWVKAKGEKNRGFV